MNYDGISNLFFKGSTIDRQLDNQISEYGKKFTTVESIWLVYGWSLYYSFYFLMFEHLNRLKIKERKKENITYCIFLVMRKYPLLPTKL